MCRSNFERGKLKLLRPVEERYLISSPFGLRIHPLSGKEKMHNGTDFATSVGVTVRAVVDGVIFRSGWQDPEDYMKGFGLRVWQKCEINKIPFYIWYGHLHNTLVVQDQVVKEGDDIGQSGNTGDSSGPHLHWQARMIDTGDFYDAEFYNKETV